MLKLQTLSVVRGLKRSLNGICLTCTVGVLFFPLQQVRLCVATAAGRGLLGLLRLLQAWTAASPAIQRGCLLNVGHSLIETVHLAFLIEVLTQQRPTLPKFALDK